MKTSDYIIQFLEEHGITDVFGYPGVGCGHFMNSMKSSSIKSHMVYHEQAAAFAACSYAQAAHKVGIAYTTAGPGATNLVTGIANAYCDSIPTVFIVGDKDYASLRKSYNVRQLTSQEINIVDITKPVTKMSLMITDEHDIKYYLEKAFYIAQEGRPGPVMLDIPSDIQRANIDVDSLRGFDAPAIPDYSQEVSFILDAFKTAKHPVVLIGNGVKQAELDAMIGDWTIKNNIPVVTTLIANDLLTDHHNVYGFIGMDGNQAANRIVGECDLILTLGARLNFKQVTIHRENFAKNARIIRVDADENELEVALRDETKIVADINYLIPALIKAFNELKTFGKEWIDHCDELKSNEHIQQSKNQVADKIVERISEIVPDGLPITIDVGSHRRWIMTHFHYKPNQRLYQSSGLVSMGYSLPACMGAYHATHKPVICFNGDGGLMMNVQELQSIHRDKLPVTVIVLNNNVLGDIMEFQKKIFDGNYFTTTETTGYESANFELIAKAFGLPYHKVLKVEDLDCITLGTDQPQLIEVVVPSNVE